MFPREEISNKNDRKSQASDIPTSISPYTHSPTLQIKVGKNGKEGHHRQSYRPNRFVKLHHLSDNHNQRWNIQNQAMYGPPGTCTQT